MGKAIQATADSPNSLNSQDQIAVRSLELSLGLSCRLQEPKHETWSIAWQTC